MVRGLGSTADGYGSWDEGASVAAIGRDGNLVTAGPNASCDCPWVVVHWNADGTHQALTVNETTGSKNTYPVGGLVVQPDGKIVIGGGNFNLVRFPGTRSTPTLIHPDPPPGGGPAVTKPVEAYAGPLAEPLDHHVAHLSSGGA